MLRNDIDDKQVDSILEAKELYLDALGVAND